MAAEKKPVVTVKSDNAQLTADTDFTVSYSSNINAGTATVTITGKGNYSGSIKKQFTITPAVFPDFPLSFLRYSYLYRFRTETRCYCEIWR